MATTSFPGTNIIQNERSTPTPSHSQSSSMSDFTSPSAFLNSDAYASTSGDSTPHYDFDHSTSSSLSLAQPQSMEEMYDFSYTDFTGITNHEEQSYEPLDHPTPSGGPNDDQTPVVPEDQQQIPLASFPTQHPHSHNGNETDLRQRYPQHVHPSELEPKPLLSPFRHDPNDASIPMTYSMPHIDPSSGIPSQQYIDAATGAIYFAPHHSHIAPTVFYDPQTAGAAQPAQLQYTVDPYQQHQQYYQSSTQYYPGPPRSQHGSPTSSVGSSGMSLPRSNSTSGDFRQVRQKVKLTFEDKRNIVELHRQNSSLRQEDIARQYGCVACLNLPVSPSADILAGSIGARSARSYLLSIAGRSRRNSSFRPSPKCARLWADASRRLRR